MNISKIENNISSGLIPNWKKSASWIPQEYWILFKNAFRIVLPFQTYYGKISFLCYR